MTCHSKNKNLVLIFPWQFLWRCKRVSHILFLYIVYDSTFLIFHFAMPLFDAFILTEFFRKVIDSRIVSMSKRMKKTEPQTKYFQNLYVYSRCPINLWTVLYICYETRVTFEQHAPYENGGELRCSGKINI